MFIIDPSKVLIQKSIKVELFALIVRDVDLLGGKCKNCIQKGIELLGDELLINDRY